MYSSSFLYEEHVSLYKPSSCTQWPQQPSPISNYFFNMQFLSFLRNPTQCFQADCGIDFSEYDKSMSFLLAVSFPDILSLSKQDINDHQVQRVYFFVSVTYYPDMVWSQPLKMVVWMEYGSNKIQSIKRKRWLLASCSASVISFISFAHTSHTATSIQSHTILPHKSNNTSVFRMFPVWWCQHVIVWSTVLPWVLSWYTAVGWPTASQFHVLRIR